MECSSNTKCYLLNVQSIKYQKEVIKLSNSKSLVNLLGSLRSVHLWKFTHVFFLTIHPIRTELKYGRKLNGRDRFRPVPPLTGLWLRLKWFFGVENCGSESARGLMGLKQAEWTVANYSIDFPTTAVKGGTQHSLPHQSCRVAAAVNSFLLISRLDTNTFELSFPFPG